MWLRRLQKTNMLMTSGKLICTHLTNWVKFACRWGKNVKNSLQRSQRSQNCKFEVQDYYIDLIWWFDMLLWHLKYIYKQLVYSAVVLYFIFKYFIENWVTTSSNIAYYWPWLIGSKCGINRIFAFKFGIHY